MVRVLILETSGHIKEIKIRYGNKSPISKLKKYLDKDNKIKENIETIATWTVENFTLTAYGFKNGNKNRLNKHELLPTPNEEKYYNDIILVKFQKGMLKDITIEEYTKYYDEFYGYYNSDDSSVEDSANSSLSCDDFSGVDSKVSGEVLNSITSSLSSFFSF